MLATSLIAHEYRILVPDLNEANFNMLRVEKEIMSLKIVDSNLAILIAWTIILYA